MSETPKPPNMSVFLASVKLRGKYVYQTGDTVPIRKIAHDLIGKAADEVYLRGTLNKKDDVTEMIAALTFIREIFIK